jgi:hypothetical protein
LQAGQGPDRDTVSADEDVRSVDPFLAGGDLPFTSQALASGVGEQDAHGVLVQPDRAGRLASTASAGRK